MSDVARTMPRFPRSPLQVVAGVPHISYGNEFDLRDGIAERAWLAGWDVETEQHIPGWGRIDLRLTCPGIDAAIEVKTELVKPSLIRRAFQQADSYSRILDRATSTVLTAGHMDPAAVGPYEARYPHIWVVSAEELLGWTSGCSRGMDERHKKALTRAAHIWSLLNTAHAVCAGLSRYADTPLDVTTDPRTDESPDAGIRAALDLFEKLVADPTGSGASPPTA